MTGYNHLKALFVWIGPPNGGKSTISNIVKSLFGSFFTEADKRVVCKSKSDSVHTAELFQLIRKRLFIVPEIEEGDNPNTRFLKALSGNDMGFSVRKCGGRDQFDVIIDCKGIIPTNVCFNTSDKALQERLKCFKFVNKFEAGSLTKEKQSFISNLDIFSVIIDFAIQFYKNDKTIVWPKEVIAANKELVNDIDVVVQFLETNFLITDSEHDRIKKLDIWEDFQRKYPEFKSLGIGRTGFYTKFKSHLPPHELHRDREFKYIRYIIEDDIDDVIDNDW
jgi:phage/plasmid-associated DNA primase